MARPPRNPNIPMRTGVSPSMVALPAGHWPTVLDFLAERLPVVTRQAWAERIASGQVLQENGQPVVEAQAYASGQRLYYYRSVEDEPELPEHETIVFEDEHLLVADKPHFMPVTPSGKYVQQSLLVRLKRQTGCADLSPIHRIDRETAGLVLLSKQPQDRNAYQALFRDRRVHKTYEAVAARPAGAILPQVHRSRLEEDALFFRMREVAGEPNSETHVRLLREAGEHALYELSPVTGKRHQLRVHMLALGTPIESDQFYPKVLKGPDDAEDFRQPLQLLARSVTFTDPVTGQSRHFTSERNLRIRP
ncbi:pseudouridine synthase [Limnohabitans radicicola]|uniref:Pseudouridine synthase n=1 Tax=Limnohabitans radicicola TaxID=2771427 RepID=A0A927FG67_9BURK|nr:pseudouridine synthase [Limnohabitans radicicola]MBD8050804.1 pseudouridine synthase [Limnohabitans radicicola]